MRSWQCKWFFLGGPGKFQYTKLPKQRVTYLGYFACPSGPELRTLTTLTPKKIVDTVFALGVSLHSSDYITDEDLRSFRLALIDDDDDTNPPLLVSTSSTGMPSRPAAEVTLATSSAALPAVAEPISVP